MIAFELKGAVEPGLKLMESVKLITLAESLGAVEPLIKELCFPGLEGHPGHDVHKRQSSGDGCVLSFVTGDLEFSQIIVERTRVFTIAVSFGSIGSTISLPCRMSHASIPKETRKERALPEDLVRISVGLECVEDLIADLESVFAFRRSQEGSQRLACVEAC